MTTGTGPGAGAPPSGGTPPGSGASPTRIPRAGHRDHSIEMAELRRIAIKPMVSIRYGVILSIALAVLMIGVLGALSELTVFTALAAIGLAGGFFWHGFENGEEIEPGWIGVPHWLGSPNQEHLPSIGVESWLFGPGKHWSFYPVLYYRVLPLEEQTITIDRFSLDAKFKFTRGRKSANNKKETKIRMEIEGTGQIIIWNPWRFLAVAGKGLFDSLTKGYVSAIKSAMAEKSPDFTESEIREKRPALRKAAERAADKISERWGIDLVDIFLTYLAPLNLAVSEAHEKVAKEVIEGEADRVEADFVIGMAERYADRLKISGNDALVQARLERGKGKGTVHIHTTSSSSGGGSDESGGIGKTIADIVASTAASAGAAFKGGMDAAAADDGKPGGTRKRKGKGKNPNPDDGES